jgi:D-hydroxyproline dehydrogenase subunit gamma
MSEIATTVSLLINDRSVQVPEGITVAAALARVGALAIRRSRTGEPRGALCGMGICHECRAEIDGVLHQRTCQVPCGDGMRIQTDA